MFVVDLSHIKNESEVIYMSKVMRCSKGLDVMVLGCGAGYYIGTVTKEEGFPHCRISESYWKKKEVAEKELKNRTFRDRICSENSYCHRGRGCRVKEVEAELGTWGELTPEQQELTGVAWVEVLNTFCSTDETGNRPCDNGMMCDKCHHDSVLRAKYKALCKERGVEWND